jgi:hypothetical protein
MKLTSINAMNVACGLNLNSQLHVDEVYNVDNVVVVLMSTMDLSTGGLQDTARRQAPRRRESFLGRTEATDDAQVLHHLHPLQQRRHRPCLRPSSLLGPLLSRVRAACLVLLLVAPLHWFFCLHDSGVGFGVLGQRRKLCA